MGILDRPAEEEAIGEVADARDARLVAAILRRDRKATGEFIARYTPPVYRYVRSRLAPRNELVDDVVQEVFLAAWQGLGDFRGDSNLRSWLLGIARHKVEDHYRAQLRQPDPLDDVDEDLVQQTSDAPTLDEMLDSTRLGKRALKVLEGLPEPYRLVLLWRYWERVPAREMAERTGKTEKAIERQLARAREQFRLRWENE